MSAALSMLVFAVIFFVGLLGVSLAIVAGRADQAAMQHHRRLMAELKRQPESEDIWGEFDA